MIDWLLRMLRNIWSKEAMDDTDPNIDTGRLLPPRRTEPSALAVTAMAIAKREIGNGEQGGNNIGPDLDRYRMGKLPGGAWCASFVSYCFTEAARQTKQELPFRISSGARRLFKNVGKAGSFPNIPTFGDVCCWRRGQGWQGHVGIVIGVGRGIFTTIEGNRGRYPSRVRVYQHELGEPDFLGFARCP